MNTCKKYFFFYFSNSELDFRTKLLTYSPKRMYELLISDYQQLIQNVSSRHIANFIGISPEWLSNLKKTI